MVYRLGNARKEQLAQHLAFAVNILVTTTREVNALKRTGFAYPWGKYLFYCHLTTLLDDNRIPRRQLVYILVFYIEDRLYSRTFRRYHYHFFISIVKRRTNTRRVAEYKSIAVTYHSFHCITTVPILSRALQDAFYIQPFRNKRRRFLFGIALFFQLEIEFFYLIV